MNRPNPIAFVPFLLAAVLPHIAGCNPLDVGGHDSKGDMARVLSDMARGVDAIDTDLAAETDLAVGPDLAYTADLACGGGALATDVIMVDFGVVKVGAPSPPRRVLLVNSGNAEIIITTVRLAGMNPSEFQTDNLPPFTLAGCQSKAIFIFFQPVQRGNKIATLVITPQGFPPLQVKLTGTAQ